MENEIQNLIFESSPFGTLDAIVEHDHRAVYFYLSSQGREGSTFGTRACWVRNLIEGPLVLNQAEMKQGLPPVLPKTYCRQSTAQPLPDPDRLEIVWFEEGNGAALVELDGSERRTLAVIPPWSGAEGFHGYSSQCAVENPICWPMPVSDQLQRRVDRACEFWQSCLNTETHPFKNLQNELLGSYEAAFGSHQRYFSIDGESFPPRGLATFEWQGSFIALTVGLSLCPMPNVELQVEDPANFRRIEFGIRLPAGLDDQAQQRVGGQLSGLANMPWRSWIWFSPQQTCGFDSLQDVLGEEYQNARFERLGDFAGPPPVELKPFRGDPVHILWLVPFQGEVKV